MRWFEHRHYWVGVESFTLSVDGTKKGEMIAQECRSCGAIRTIEIYVGKDPIIRMATPPSEDKQP